MLSHGIASRFSSDGIRTTHRFLRICGSKPDREWLHRPLPERETPVPTEQNPSVRKTVIPKRTFHRPNAGIENFFPFPACQHPLVC